MPRRTCKLSSVKWPVRGGDRADAGGVTKLALRKHLIRES